MTEPQVVHLEDSDREAALRTALEALDHGELICVPTETVYGVGGRADRPAALQSLRVLKSGADAERPFSLHVGSTDRLDELVEMPRSAKRLARAYLPGPLTMVLDAKARAKAWGGAGRQHRRARRRSRVHG